MTNKQEIFAFLNMLREKGVTDPAGAVGPYIEDVFDLDSGTARSVLMEWEHQVAHKMLTELTEWTKWIETFDKRHPRSE